MFICSAAPVWLMLSATIERITHSSSAWVAMYGNNRLTSNPALAMPIKLPERAEQVGRFRVHQLRLLDRQRLAVTLRYLRLGIEQIDLRRAAGHVEEDAALARGATSVAAGASGFFARLPARQLRRAQQLRRREQTEAAARATQHLAAMNVPHRSS